MVAFIDQTKSGPGEHKMPITYHSYNGVSIMFYYDWASARYGVLGASNGYVFKDVVCSKELPAPEMPDKRVIENYFKQFEAYCKGDESYADIFAPRPHHEAKSFALQQIGILAANCKPGLSLG